VEARELSPAFKLAVFVLLGLTVVFFALAVGFSIGLAHPTASQSSAESWLFGAASSTLSALVGLFAGKVT
jgi:hypothetical protein